MHDPSLEQLLNHISHLCFASFPYFLLACYFHHRDLRSFPTRRSSDLVDARRVDALHLGEGAPAFYGGAVGQDRKSTRLNSSHLVISYAVFCLKKKINYRTLRKCKCF